MCMKWFMVFRFFLQTENRSVTCIYFVDTTGSSVPVLGLLRFVSLQIYRRRFLPTLLWKIAQIQTDFIAPVNSNVKGAVKSPAIDSQNWIYKWSSLSRFTEGLFLQIICFDLNHSTLSAVCLDSLSCCGLNHSLCLFQCFSVFSSICVLIEFYRQGMYVFRVMHSVLHAGSNKWIVVSCNQSNFFTRLLYPVHDFWHTLNVTWLIRRLGLSCPYLSVHIMALWR